MFRKTIFSLLIISLVLIVEFLVTNNDQSQADSSQRTRLKVYPGAEGFGTETIAGRGGDIIKVTNLNGSGPGSLRAALDTDGARIVVFEVGGTIALERPLAIDSPYITIAGQTAPSPGVTLKGAGVTIRTHDVLMQHLRIRVGDAEQGAKPMVRDGFEILGPQAYNVVVDHVSVSWAIDENGSTWYPLMGVTINQCIFSEGLRNSSHPKGPHSMGLLIGDHSHNVFLKGNLFAHNSERNPRINGDTSVVLINNLSFNTGSSAFVLIGSQSGPSRVSAVGNVFIRGPNTRPKTTAISIREDSADGTVVFLQDNQSSVTEFSWSNNSDPRVLSPPVWTEPVTILNSRDVEGWVLSTAGARPADRDVVDRRIVKDVRRRKGTIIDSQEQIGGWPQTTVVTRTFNIPPQPHDDDDGDGYTNIEEVLHQMARDLEKSTQTIMKSAAIEKRLSRQPNEDA